MNEYEVLSDETLDKHAEAIAEHVYNDLLAHVNWEGDKLECSEVDRLNLMMLTCRLLIDKLKLYSH